MPFLELKRQLAADISDFLKQPEFTAEVIEPEFSTPPNPALGHVALPCFKLSKVMRQAPDKIARSFAEHFTKGGMSAVATGPYINFKWDTGALYQKTVDAIFQQKESYGSDKSGAGKRILLEYCSPNIAKRLAFQHIRSTLIGSTLAAIYETLGYDVERINFVGDWGTQFAGLLAAVEMWGDKNRLSTKDVAGSIRELNQLYVRFNDGLEKENNFSELAAACLKRLEEKETKTTDLWNLIREISLITMNKTLTRMNVSFDHVEGESRYIPEIATTLNEIKAKSGAVLSEGAWIVEVPDIPTPALVQKKDGTTLYLTRDICAAIDRFDRFSFHKAYYVVSSAQKLHFDLLFGVLKKMGYAWADRCEHLSFGTVFLNSEKMSTRKGTVIFLDDLIDEAKRLALVECTQKNPELPNKEEVAEQIGLGAIVFGELASHRQRDIDFDWKTALAFDGETGPYVQYSLVRCYSLFRKAAEKSEKAKPEFKPTNYEFVPEEDALILELARYRSALHLTIRENEPFHLTRYLIELAKSFNRFYYKLPVLQSADANQRQLRLNLVQATQQVFLNGFGLLGLKSPKEM